MDRRTFVTRGLAAASALGIASTASRVGALTPEARVGQSKPPSGGKDPLAIQRATLVVNGLDVSDLNERYLARLRTGGVNCWHKSTGDLAAFGETYRFIDDHRTQITAARTVKEIRAAHQKGRISLVFGWQQADLVAGGARTSSVGTLLRAYHELGLRVVGITYNLVNLFGGGCLEPQVGLTRAGRHLVEEIHKLRILLDVGGHTGEQTSLDAVAMSSDVPVVCTHTNVARLNDNPRCTSDRVMEAIARTGGVIGLTAFNDFIARSRTDAQSPRTAQVGLEKYLDQFDYIRKLVGADHVGIGPDFIQAVNGPLPIPLNRTLFPVEMMSDTCPRCPYVKGFESIDELPNVTRGLVDRGWSEPDIHKALGDNWLRVYQRVWGA